MAQDSGISYEFGAVMRNGSTWGEMAISRARG